MIDEIEDPCYGLDVSNNHDEGVVSFVFLDTGKKIHLNQLELSILSNYILDQYNTVDDTNSLDTIKNITSRINSLEDCLTSQISSINQNGKVDVTKMLCDFSHDISDETREELSSEIPIVGKSILER
jgi:hypothetical protein